MTSNQINYYKAREEKRKNLANEALRDKELDELVKNNLRNYRINLDKNELTALYNRQLNQRELQKMANDWYVKLQQLQNESTSNVIKREMNALQTELQNSRNVNTTTNALIHAISGFMGAIVGKALTGNGKDDDNSGNGKTNNGKVTQEIIDDAINQFYAAEDASNDKISKIISTLGALISGTAIASAIPAVSESLVFGFSGSAPVSAPSEATYVPSNNEQSNFKRWMPYVGFIDGTEQSGKKKEIDEIPTDHTFSGPAQITPPIIGGVKSNISQPTNHTFDNPVISLTPPATSKTKRDYESSGDGGRTSGGTDYHVSGGHHSSGTIISPGVTWL